MMSSSFGAMDSLLVKLRSLLVYPEDQLPEPLKPQKDNLELLLRDLEIINTYLLNLSGLEAPKTFAKLWMQEARDLSYDIMDFIDKTMQPYSSTNEESLSEEEELSTLVEQAYDTRNRHDRYDLGPKKSDPRVMVVWQGPGQALSQEPMDLVGIDDSRTELIRKLNNGTEQQLKVVSVLGPAGVGKTTLAKEVYRQIGGQFEHKVFVRASRMPDIRRLLQSMISKVQHHQRPPSGLLVQDLIDDLSECLQHKRYLIVIDDLWETRTWHIVNSAFPKGTHCSRILITTNIEEVALECCGYEFDAVFQMKTLSKISTIELFFSRLHGSKPKPSEQLKETYKETIRACSGLPLATVSIASLLASQQDNSELCRHVKEFLSSRLSNNLTSESMLKEIVGLSYISLPRHLKTCLLYFSMYPEGYIFFKADLVKQWSAEDFTSGVEGKDSSEVAECYFDELVRRGLIQSDHINFSDTTMSYTVHSNMYEVIRYISIEENFTTVIDYSNTIPELSAKVRRLSLRYSNAKYAAKPEGITLSPVRSLLFYGLVECLPSITEFEVLRVLNLEFWGDQEELDLSGISQLFQLRYVRITTDIVVKLPAEMKGLKYLQTLEICARVASVPPDIVHLPKLLHLSLRGEINLSDGISHMRSLRTLRCFDLSSNSEDNVRQLGEMTNLHDLHLTGSTEVSSDPLKRNLIALVPSLEKLGNLKSLILAPAPSCASIYLDCSSSMSSLPVSFQRLELLPPICIFSRLPEWIGLIQKLRILKIVVSELTRDDVNIMAMLQELTVLSLYVRQPTAEIIIFKGATFPVLKYFKFRCGILRLAFKAEALANLQCLDLKVNVHKGVRYDDLGIENLLNLQEITVRIGAAPGAEESDITAAESAFKYTICRHSRPLSFSITRVNSIIEEIPQYSDLLGRTPHSEDLLNTRTRAHTTSSHDMMTSGPVLPGHKGFQRAEDKVSNIRYGNPPSKISHPAHLAHKLKLVTGTGAPFLCNGCKEPGNGPRYTCGCNGDFSFDLHTCCALAEDTLVHPLFHKCTFKFLPEPTLLLPPDYRICDACGEYVQGFFYHCFEKDLDLHPSCACLPECIIHDGHVFELQRRASRPCGFCGDKKGLRHCFWAYRTYFDGDAVDLHMGCMKEMARLSWEDIYHQKHMQKRQEEKEGEQVEGDGKREEEGGGGGEREGEGKGGEHVEFDNKRDEKEGQGESEREGEGKGGEEVEGDDKEEEKEGEEEREGEGPLLSGSGHMVQLTHPTMDGVLQNMPQSKKRSSRLSNNVASIIVAVVFGNPMATRTKDAVIWPSGLLWDYSGPSLFL